MNDETIKSIRSKSTGVARPLFHGYGYEREKEREYCFSLRPDTGSGTFIKLFIDPSHRFASTIATRFRRTVKSPIKNVSLTLEPPTSNKTCIKDIQVQLRGTETFTRVLLIFEDSSGKFQTNHFDD